VGNQLTKQCCEVLTVFKAFGWATHNKAFSVSVPVCVRVHSPPLTSFLTLVIKMNTAQTAFSQLRRRLCVSVCMCVLVLSPICSEFWPGEVTEWLLYKQRSGASIFHPEAFGNTWVSEPASRTGEPGAYQ